MDYHEALTPLSCFQLFCVWRECSGAIIATCELFPDRLIMARMRFQLSGTIVYRQWILDGKHAVLGMINK